MVKLLYIVPNVHNSGGVARVLSTKLNYLVEKYHYKIYLINTTGIIENLFYYFDEKIEIYSLDQKELKLFNVLNYKNKINILIKKIQPNIIINCDNGLKGSILPFFIKRDVPIIYENHGGLNFLSESFIEMLKIKLARYIFNLSTNRYSWIILLSDVGYSELENNMVIPNPMTFKIPKETTTFKQKVVITVGRFSFQKGYDNLIKIWALVIKKHPNWVLNIYGEGDSTSYKKLALKLNILDSVNFHKQVKDIEQVYLDATILVNTSRFEPFGLALIEAMACGLPVIAFQNTLGPRSFILNNENGFLIEKGDLNGYANKIIELINNIDEMKKISLNAKESMKDYELPKIMKQWHELFQSIN